MRSQPSNQSETPQISGGTNDDIYAYRDKLTEIYAANDNNLDSVNDAVSNTLSTESGQENSAPVRIAESIFLMNNANYQLAIDSINKLDIESLDEDQRMMCYEVLAYSNSVLDNQEQADYYNNLVWEMMVERGGEGG